MRTVSDSVAGGGDGHQVIEGAIGAGAGVNQGNRLEVEMPRRFEEAGHGGLGVAVFVDDLVASEQRVRFECGVVRRHR